MKKVWKCTGIALLIAAILLILSLVVYFFNLDMKLAAKMQPLLNRWYDRFPRPPLP
jgi:hypothetical protein